MTIRSQWCINMIQGGSPKYQYIRGRGGRGRGKGEGEGGGRGRGKEGEGEGGGGVVLQFMLTWYIPAWRQIPQMRSGAVSFTNWMAHVKMYKHIYWYTFCHFQQLTYIAGCLVLVASALLFQSSPEHIEMCVFNISSDARIWFQKATWVMLPVVVRTNNLIRVHTGADKIVRRTPHNNKKPNVKWFPDKADWHRYEYFQAKYHAYWNSYIPATESKLSEPKLYYLFNALVYMLRRGAFINLSTYDFNGMIKNCVPTCGSSKS